jgi:chloramphenicol 3-O-phosphotransferase
VTDAPADFASPVKLVLITGNPGGGKTVVSRLLGCLLPEPWEVVHLDHYLYLKTADTGNFWNDVEASAPIRASSIRFYRDRGGRVIYEGIIQSDAEVSVYCKAAGVARESEEFRFFDLRCARDEGVRRMKRRPLKESATFPFSQHYDGLVARLRATGATRITTDGRTPEEVADQIRQNLTERF